MDWDLPTEECMPACLEAQPAGFDGTPRCICERLCADEEAWRAEPEDMAIREWGTF
ncbi:hypothetical protein OIE91_11250 [Streptomyces albidoflavus]|uniref:hypothetical protein n=1 Tax=Streptomyces albidoflavus TaxID=1886 RepID=UPI00352E8EF0